MTTVPPGGTQRSRRLSAIERRHLEVTRSMLAAAAELSQAAASEAEKLTRAVAMCITALKRGKQILFCGNGGSAAQASHLACELSGRFYQDRGAINAMSLTDNTAAITAIANDYGYDRVFDRQLEAVSGAGDVLVALTTSGASPNIRRAVSYARKHGLETIGLTGERGRAFARRCDLGFVVPSADTPRIQEIHILLGHIICARIESELFGEAK